MSTDQWEHYHTASQMLQSTYIEENIPQDLNLTDLFSLVNNTFPYDPKKKKSIEKLIHYIPKDKYAASIEMSLKNIIFRLNAKSGEIFRELILNDLIDLNTNNFSCLPQHLAYSLNTLRILQGCSKSRKVPRVMIDRVEWDHRDWGNQIIYTFEEES